MAGNRLIPILLLLLLFGCDRESQSPQPEAKSAPLVILKPKPKVMTPEQKKELGFPEDIVAQAEREADAPAEPFYEDVMMRTANLKGDVMITGNRLSGISVRTGRSDELISRLSPGFRKRGFLIFRSERNYGKVPDIVTVVRGNNSYDILKIQGTEAVHYHLKTAAIIKWLKERQKAGSFVITGAGADWLEAKFIKPPQIMLPFARKVAAFAPDVLTDGTRTVEKLAERMQKTNGFALWWE